MVSPPFLMLFVYRLFPLFFQDVMFVINHQPQFVPIYIQKSLIKNQSLIISLDLFTRPGLIPLATKKKEALQLF